MLLSGTRQTRPVPGSHMKRNQMLTGMAWSLYAASWFLTVIPEEGGQARIPGWHAFLIALMPDSGLPWKVLYVSSALTNIIPVASLLTLSNRFRRLSSTFSWL